MRKLYNTVDDILNAIDFDCIWRGFSRFPFALYDKNNVYLKDEVISHDRRFLGNTSIEYNGEFIAIWMVDDPSAEDPEALAANLVHEMFHAFQNKNHDKRFPSDLLLLNYPDSEENYAAKHSENRILAKAFETQDVNEKRTMIEQFISARKYREGLIGDIIKHEYLSETIEGMAEYAGCMALKQTSAEKYAKRINEYIENLRAFDSRFFHVRRMLYYSGAIFCLLLSEVNMDFYHAIGDTKLSLFEIVAANAAAKKPELAFDTTFFTQQVFQNITEKKQKHSDFLSSHDKEIAFCSSICGYDPMNMIKLGDRILCTHFIMLKSQDNEKPLFLQGPVIINLKPGSINEVQSYIK